ncbi:TPA: hypothetical protein ACVOYU_004606 [Vibrio alginolyticus]
MEHLLKDELMTLFAKYDKQKSDEMNDDYDFNEYETFLEYQLLGVSKFIKSIAYKMENVELLGVATKIELDVLHEIEKENQAHDEYYQFESQAHNYSMQARRFCIQLFYEECRYHADMTKYQDLVEANRDSLEKAGLLDKLKRYVDEKKVLDKIYNEVKHSLMYSTEDSLPEKSVVDEMFKAELQEIYRKAENHINKQLKKAQQFE